MEIPKNQALPWGRTLEEYIGMFHLSDRDLDSAVLGCADGPASFNAEMTALGRRVVSADPIYQLSREDIASRVEVARQKIMADTLEHMDDYVWTSFASPEELEARRLGAVRSFLDDYDAGLKHGRYLAQSLPSLDFPDRSFDLALCSHFLFLYSDQFDAAFHLDSIVELRRVAAEVRIFPVLDLSSRVSAHLEYVIAGLERRGYRVGVEAVPYEFQKGACQMLRVA